METIRTLNLNDLDAFQSIRALSLQLNPLSFGTSYEERHTREIVEKEWKTKKEEDFFIVGCFDESQKQNPLVGFIRCSRVPKIKMRHIVEIVGVFVHPNYRGKGIGGQLLKKCLDRIREMEGVEKVNLRVSLTSIAALKLYKKMGFVEFGREENSLIWQGNRVTTVYMSLRIVNKITSRFL